MTAPLTRDAVIARLRRTRNWMLKQAGEARRRGEIEAAHCVREAEAVDRELARMGVAPGPGGFRPDGSGPEGAA